MSIFRKLSRNNSKLKPGDLTCEASQSSKNKDFVPIPQRSDSVPEGKPERRRHSRTHSLGNLFTRRRQSTNKGCVLERYDIDFWERNFPGKSTVPWHEFRAAFVLDYKRCIEEFARTGHLGQVFKAVEEQLCNKDMIVYIVRYKRFIGPEAPPDAIWLKIREDARQMVFEDGLFDSLCL